MAIIVRKAIPADNPQLQLLTKHSFGSATLGVVYQLYLRNEFLELLVAEDNGVIIGAQGIAAATISFGKAKQDMNIGALLSLSIYTDRVHDGIQHPLIESAVDYCRNAQFQAAAVTSLYPCYRKHGFKSASEFNIRGEGHIPADALLIAELKASAFSGESGVVKYQLSQLAL